MLRMGLGLAAVGAVVLVGQFVTDSITHSAVD